MVVLELIEILKKFPADLPVAYAMYSEYRLLEERDLETLNLCLARADSWVACERPDKPSIPYLVFPGN